MSIHDIPTSNKEVKSEFQTVTIELPYTLIEDYKIPTCAWINYTDIIRNSIKFEF